jgi:hypothetical protein
MGGVVRVLQNVEQRWSRAYTCAICGSCTRETICKQQTTCGCTTTGRRCNASDGPRLQTAELMLVTCYHVMWAAFGGGGYMSDAQRCAVKQRQCCCCQYRRTQIATLQQTQVHNIAGFVRHSLPGVTVGDPVLVTLYSVFPSLCVPSVSAGNLATSPVPGTVSQHRWHPVTRVPANIDTPAAGPIKNSALFVSPLGHTCPK